jgi:hypothetical protein
MSSPADKLIETLRGPTNIVLYCTVKGCSQVEVIKRLRPLGQPCASPEARYERLAYGLATRNEARGRLVRHIKAVHPDEYKEKSDELLRPGTARRLRDHRRQDL